ncbi:MAG: glycerol-3-phosphate 1-O-acyltransferase PlsY [Deltaproteobacteria bacterium]|nr:glycerol-3-phosphate 1-O-acyltransferase PlsY [Deltaproteobacteria bacterium]
MDRTSVYIVFIIASYLIGSIPTGIVISRLMGKGDPRKAGSGNIGATNVGRTSGKLAGILTLLGDALKGGVPVFLAFQYYPESLFVSLVGLAAFLGHLFPVYLGFKGGKGVATGLGVMVVICPIATLLSAAVFAVVAYLKKYVSLASIIAAAMLPVFMSFFPRGRNYVGMAVLVAVLVIIKHKDNIKRLVAGTENKIGGQKK